MQRRVERELADSDIALLVMNGEEGIGPGDRFIARALLGASADTPDDLRGQQGRSDRAERAGARPRRGGRAGRGRRGLPGQRPQREGLAELVERLGELIPEGPYLYPPQDHSDQSSELLLAELIREQVLNRTRRRFRTRSRSRSAKSRGERMA